MATSFRGGRGSLPAQPLLISGTSWPSLSGGLHLCQLVSSLFMVPWSVIPRSFSLSSSVLSEGLWTASVVVAVAVALAEAVASTPWV